jgi:hypothetical protein
MLESLSTKKEKKNNIAPRQGPMMNLSSTSSLLSALHQARANSLRSQSLAVFFSLSDLVLLRHTLGVLQAQRNVELMMLNKSEREGWGWHGKIQ